MNGQLGPVDVILLAAGGSSRLGRPKQLLPLGERTLVEVVADQALRSQARRVTVVLGAQADRLIPLLEKLELSVCLNPAWESGLGCSIRVGMEHLLNMSRPRPQAVVCLAVDQPLVTSQTIDGLIKEAVASQARIVASSYAGTVGVPALFQAFFFPQLLQLDGDQGARSLIHQHRSQVKLFPFPEGAVDIDTEKDYARLLARLGRG